MNETQVWPRRISPGRQITVPAELMAALELEVGSLMYVVFHRGQVLLLRSDEVESAIDDAVERSRKAGGATSRDVVHLRAKKRGPQKRSG